jgi:hypothetical protein
MDVAARSYGPEGGVPSRKVLPVLQIGLDLPKPPKLRVQGFTNFPDGSQLAAVAAGFQPAFISEAELHCVLPWEVRIERQIEPIGGRPRWKAREIMAQAHSGYPLWLGMGGVTHPVIGDYILE